MRTNHEIDYKIVGEEMQYVEIELLISRNNGVSVNNCIHLIMIFSFARLL
jgi:hypothetical protein